MKTIMIVEDNPMIHEKLIDIFRMENYSTLHAGNALIAIEMMKAALPDLIITDITMPGLDGFQFILKLKNTERTQHLPILILSAKIGDKYEKRSEELGVLKYLTKPISVQDLLDSVELALKTQAAD